MSPNRRTAVAALAAAPWTVRARDAAPLRYGLTPYLSPVALLGRFRPLREQLERRLGTPVQMVTARDFAAHAAAAQRGDYEMAMLPAHLARLAVADWSWQPLARTLLSTEVLVVVRADGPIATAADLRRRRVGMLDPLSLSAAVGQQWLRAEGLQETVAVVAVPSINSAIYALARDEVAAVVASTSQLAELPASTPGGFRPLARLAEIPAQWHLARPDAPAATVARWREALLAFEPDPAQPRSVSNVRLTPLTHADTEVAEPYAVFLRRQLAGLR